MGNWECLCSTIQERVDVDKSETEGDHVLAAAVQRPILAIHPSEGRALTVSQPAERRPMSLSGSLRPGQAEAGWEEKQGHCC
ncbi:hypothetical protein FQN60_002402 [Etheostoma spectabile]|uniref:Uncharacterized protein n=1 Tax=Etheostoma spectabile TaxID=54343 RepID=A0A5J5DCC3_9PERO|nr:hypothetical protein FQN60_002402 [Etheostoma spectabile]